MKTFNVIIEKDEEGYYISEVVGLPGCHTQAKTIDELIERTKEAIAPYLESELELEIQNKFIGIQQMSLQKS